MLGLWIKANWKWSNRRWQEWTSTFLGISELKWTGIGEFNSHDHYIYYSGQESLRRNGVDITVNKRVQNADSRVSSLQSLSHVRLFATPWITACQASLSITNSRSSLRLTSIESVMPSSHLILCHALLLLPAISPSIRVFSSESTLHMRWPKEQLNWPDVLM